MWKRCGLAMHCNCISACILDVPPHTNVRAMKSLFTPLHQTPETSQKSPLDRVETYAHVKGKGVVYGREFWFVKRRSVHEVVVLRRPERPWPQKFTQTLCKTWFWILIGPNLPGVWVTWLYSEFWARVWPTDTGNQNASFAHAHMWPAPMCLCTHVTWTHVFTHVTWTHVFVYTLDWTHVFTHVTWPTWWHTWPSPWRGSPRRPRMRRWPWLPSLPRAEWRRSRSGPGCTAG